MRQDAGIAFPPNHLGTQVPGRGGKISSEVARNRIDIKDYTEELV